MISVDEKDVYPGQARVERGEWPKHLSPYIQGGVHTLGGFPTVSEPPIEIEAYEPFRIALRLTGGILTKGDFLTLRGDKLKDQYAWLAGRNQPDTELVDEVSAIGLAQRKLRAMLNGRKIVIAGGSIRDMYLLESPKPIKDIDVWILDCDEAQSDTILMALADVLYQVGGSYIAAGDYFVDRLRQKPHNRTLNVANVGLQHFPHPVQVMTSKATSVEELLDNFDWGICKFAYDGESFWFPGWKDIAQKHMSLSDNIADPYWTMRRGFLLAEKLKNLPKGRKLYLRKKEVLALLHMWLMEFDGKEETTG